MTRYGKSKLPLHVRITYRGLAEQANDFFNFSKKDTKQTKGRRKSIERRIRQEKYYKK